MLALSTGRRSTRRAFTAPVAHIIYYLAAVFKTFRLQLWLRPRACAAPLPDARSRPAPAILRCLANQELARLPVQMCRQSGRAVWQRHLRVGAQSPEAEPVHLSSGTRHAPASLRRHAVPAIASWSPASCSCYHHQRPAFRSIIRYPARGAPDHVSTDRGAISCSHSTATLFISPSTKLGT